MLLVVVGAAVVVVLLVVVVEVVVVDACARAVAANEIRRIKATAAARNARFAFPWIRHQFRPIRS